MITGMTSGVVSLIGWTIEIYIWIIIIASLSSWIPMPLSISSVLRRLSSPLLVPIQRLLPTRQYGLDFSPLIAILLLIVIKSLVMHSILLAVGGILNIIKLILVLYMTILALSIVFQIFPNLWMQTGGFWPQLKLFVKLLTEPVIVPVRQRLPKHHYPFDIAPLVLMGILLILLVIL